MRGITGVLTVLAVLLAACSTAPEEPDTLPVPTSLGSTSTEPARPSAGESLEPATQIEPADSAIAFLNEYMRLVQDSVRSVEALKARREMYAVSCSTCSEGSQVAEQLLQSGMRVRGGQIQHTSEVLDVEGDVVLIAVTYSIAPIELLDGAGEVAESAEASGPNRQAVQMGLQEDGSWLILAISDLS